MSLSDNIVLIQNGFTRLDYAYDYPAQYVCKLCDLITNESECPRCSKKFYQSVASECMYYVRITWIKWLQ